MPTVGLERRRQIDLIRGNFEDIGPARPERFERQRGHANIAAHLGVDARRA